jgi:hypothetical protein
MWIDVMRDLEYLMNDHERLLDAWAAGGVDGLAIGPMLFNEVKLLPGPKIAWTGGPAVPAFDPNPAIYQRLGVEPPAKPEALPEKRALLEKTLTAAKKRGWSVLIFQASYGAGPGGSGHVFADEKTRTAICARMVDTLQHYPMVDGAIMDGPEWGYEIAPHHMNYRSYIFNDLPESVAGKCAELGYDYGRLVAAKDRFYDCLHTLDPRRVGLHAPGGVMGAFELFGEDPDLYAWLRFRVEALTAFFRGVSDCVRAEVGRPIKLGVGPRSSAFAPLCGYDMARLAEFMDILLPKHYFWQRGFDGLIGTVYRYVETLAAWSPALGDVEALAVVRALFGLALPGVCSRSDLESALTPEFCQEIVAQETRRVLAVVDDPQRIVPWVDAGRFPHDGDPMSARDLRMVLEAAQAAGLQRYLYHHAGNLTSGEWAVMSELCGKAWRSLESDYQPPDMLVL